MAAQKLVGAAAAVPAQLPLQLLGSVQLSAARIPAVGPTRELLLIVLHIAPL